MFGRRKAVAPTGPAGAVTDEQTQATATAVATEPLPPVTDDYRRLLWAVVAGYANGEARITPAFLAAMPVDVQLEVEADVTSLIVRARR